MVFVQQGVLDGDGLGNAEGLGDLHHLVDDLLRGGWGAAEEDPIDADDVHSGFVLW